MIIVDIGNWLNCKLEKIYIWDSRWEAMWRPMCSFLDVSNTSLKWPRVFTRLAPLWSRIAGLPTLGSRKKQILWSNCHQLSTFRGFHHLFMVGLDHISDYTGFSTCPRPQCLPTQAATGGTWSIASWCGWRAAPESRRTLSAGLVGPPRQGMGGQGWRLSLGIDMKFPKKGGPLVIIHLKGDFPL